LRGNSPFYFARFSHSSDAKGFSVQKVGWILLAMVVLGWVASEMPVENAKSSDRPVVRTCWRHTADGWEDANQWHTDVPGGRPDFHPILVVLLQIAAVAGVAWLGNERERGEK
jgi:hypothetical protein